MMGLYKSYNHHYHYHHHKEYYYIIITLRNITKRMLGIVITGDWKQWKVPDLHGKWPLKWRVFACTRV